jgi:hypothetical protein
MSQRKFKRTQHNSQKTKPAERPAPDHQPMIQAMVWYKEEHWDILIAMFSDADLLPKSYSDWLVRAEEKKKEVQDDGDIVIKVFIDPETFPEWCKKKGLPMDAEARSQLALEVAQDQSFSL